MREEPAPSLWPEACSIPSYPSSMPHLKGLHKLACRNPSSTPEAQPQGPTPHSQPPLGHTWEQGMCASAVISSFDNRLEEGVGHSEPCDVTPRPPSMKDLLPHRTGARQADRSFFVISFFRIAQLQKAASPKVTLIPRASHIQ